MSGASVFSRIGKAAGRFAGANQGNVAVIFAIAAVPIVSFVGAAVDYSRLNAARTAMQAAMDSTALMLSKDLTAGTIAASDIPTKAPTYFNALYTNNDANGVTVTGVYTPPAGSTAAKIKIDGSGNVTTNFLKLAGFPKLDFGTSSTTTWGLQRMRVALVLDVTGSMNDDGKMTAMKPAAKALIDKVMALGSSTGDIYMSIIPFAKDVNVGASNYNANWINWSEWNDDNGFSTCTAWDWRGRCTSSYWTPANHNTWNGCVTDRDQNYDTLNTAPTGGPSTQFYAEQYNACPAQLMPLSSDITALKAKIDALTPNGGTNQPIGIAWGWQSLTNSAPLAYPAEDPNYTYKKALIVMSDGLNTQDRWPSYGNGQTQFNGQIDARQRILCDNIKADGITIYSMHVNTNGDPTSAVLQYCASSSDKFSTVTSSSQIAQAFDNISTSLTKLRVAK